LMRVDASIGSTVSSLKFVFRIQPADVVLSVMDSAQSSIDKQNEIHEAMAVMDNKTGKLLTTGNSGRAISTNKHGAYCQPMNSVDWHKALIGGGIKGTNTIESYSKTRCKQSR